MRGPQQAPTKLPINIRLDEHVVGFYRASGAGWQSRLNDDLGGLVAARLNPQKEKMMIRLQMQANVYENNSYRTEILADYESPILPQPGSQVVFHLQRSFGGLSAGKRVYGTVDRTAYHLSPTPNAIVFLDDVLWSGKDD